MTCLKTLVTEDSTLRLRRHFPCFVSVFYRLFFPSPSSYCLSSSLSSSIVFFPFAFFHYCCYHYHYYFIIIFFLSPFYCFHFLSLFSTSLPFSKPFSFLSSLLSLFLPFPPPISSNPTVSLLPTPPLGHFPIPL